MEKSEIENKMPASSEIVQEIQKTEEQEQKERLKKRRIIARQRALEIDDPRNMTEETDRLVGVGKHWMPYWYRRLKPEIDMLPGDVRPLLRKMIDNVLLDQREIDTLKKYVGIRRKGIPIVLPNESKQQTVEEMEMESLEYVSRMLNQLEQIGESDKERAEAQTPNQVTQDLNQAVSDRLELLKHKGKEGLEDFRVQKLQVMEKFKLRLADIDALRDYSEEEIKKRRAVHYEPDTGGLFVFQGTKQTKITLGDIVADMDWGIKYRPAPIVPENIWRRIRKTSDMAEARQEVEEIFNNELRETFPQDTSAGATTLSKLEQHINDKGGHWAWGGIAGERMAKNLLRRLSLRYNKYLFKVESSNPLEDSRLKYDFKIHFSRYMRGIATEPVNLKRDEYVKAKCDIGIQFTLGSGGKSKQMKLGKKRIYDKEFRSFIKRPVDDIVLVKLSFDAFSMYRRWLREGRPTGGPEQYLTRKQKVEILKKAVQGRMKLSDAEIEKLIL